MIFIGHTQKNAITQSVKDDFGYILIDTLAGGEYLEILIPEDGDVKVNTKYIKNS